MGDSVRDPAETPTHVDGDTAGDAREGPTSDTPTRAAPPGQHQPGESPKVAPSEEWRYARGELLGRGAMGAVHLCGDRRLEREVAIKLIRPEHAGDASLRARFLREARVQGRLDHPGIVPVYDLAVDAGGTPYFTMKRVQGQSLRSILDALQRGDADAMGRFNQRRLLEAFGTVCLTVAFAHSRGVIHRDIKPSNIMLGDFGEVYLLDWGIAKVLRPAGDEPDLTREAASLGAGADGVLGATESGELLGTPGFIAPEMIQDSLGDERTDIYALGATLFEMLALVSLHPKGPDAILSTLRGADARVSVRAPDRDVAPELEDLCVRATALDPSRRPANVREMHVVIQRVLGGFRDVERNREISALHASRARLELARARLGAPDARERALQEVHRAIVLDAGNQDAIEVLRRLASERGSDTSSDAARMVHRTNVRIQTMLARLTVVLFAPWFGAIAVLCLFGVRSPWPLALTEALVAGAALLTWARARRESIGLAMAALAVADAAAAFGGCTFGPFVLVPGLLACTTLIYSMIMSPEMKRILRAFAVAAALMAFFVPLVLEWAGVLTPSIAVRHDAIVLLPRAIWFPPAWTVAFFVVENALLIVVPALVAGHVRDRAIRTEQRALESAEKMRKMLPRVAQALMPSRPGWTPPVDGSTPSGGA